jgi:hypothetical protein
VPAGVVKKRSRQAWSKGLVEDKGKYIGKVFFGFYILRVAFFFVSFLFSSFFVFLCFYKTVRKSIDIVASSCGVTRWYW